MGVPLLLHVCLRVSELVIHEVLCLGRPHGDHVHAFTISWLWSSLMLEFTIL